jgi:hypothetical protein
MVVMGIPASHDCCRFLRLQQLVEGFFRQTGRLYWYYWIGLEKNGNVYYWWAAGSACRRLPGFALRAFSSLRPRSQI